MWFSFFIVSVLINIFLLLFVRWLIRQIEIVNEEANRISSLMEEFSLHLSSIYEMEMFYGDETLDSLMKHSRKLTEELANTDFILNEEPENPPEPENA